ncbi:MAG: imidazole glycerol phosphate synthase subunit HisH [Proteobacteria bacterium]|nr:imidazole glycerol phosphate synthase subunit HisH [Pseudomonadota bacterium]
MRLAIVDCGVNNLTSVSNAVSAAGLTPEIVDEPDQLLAADRLVLPGVGAAAEALARLRAKGLDQALEEAVRRRGRPLLGICLGMQMLADELLEFGCHRGLGWIRGQVVPLDSLPDFADRSPHMGWNSVDVAPAAEALLGRPRGERSYYFCHSFTLTTPTADRVIATTVHGRPLVAAVQFDTVLATQFHPERSHVNGMRLFAAFAAWTP